VITLLGEAEIGITHRKSTNSVANDAQYA
jgi:hypothetical protein